jgi:hypothetical protein
MLERSAEMPRRTPIWWRLLLLLGPLRDDFDCDPLLGGIFKPCTIATGLLDLLNWNSERSVEKRVRYDDSKLIEVNGNILKFTLTCLC